VLGDAARIFDQLEAYRRVTSDDVVRLARARLTATQRTTLLVRPSGEDDGDGGDADGNDAEEAA
jgi:hypothetical protein